MDETFIAHTDALKPKLQQLLAMRPTTADNLPKSVPQAGVYLFSEGDRHLYVGRSNKIRARIGRHSKPSATYRMAAFAFRIAREETGNVNATYKKGKGSREGLMQDPLFSEAFKKAKARISHMSLRFVEESDPVRQGLLEIYVAVVLKTPYNDFDTH